MNDYFKIHFLGCGSAKPSMRHLPACTVVEYRDNLMMVDCGEGAQLSFMKQRLKFNRVSDIFITHLHGDHVFGLPGLVGSLALSGVEGKLRIHTFADGKEMLESIFGYFNRNSPLSIEWNVIRPEEKVIWETKSLRVRTIPLRHKVPAVGYVFEEKEKLRHLDRKACDFYGVPMSRYNLIKGGTDYVTPEGVIVPNERLTTPPDSCLSYAHISDTSYIPGLAEKIKGVNLLFHETTYLEESLKDAKDRGHSTARQAAKVALDACAGRLVTGHYSSRYKDDTLFQKEASEIFPDVIIGNEGLVVPV